MWFTAQDRAFPITDFVISDSLAAYHNIMSFSCPSKLYVNEGRIEIDSVSFDVCVTGQTRMQNEYMRVDCVTKEVRKAFSDTVAGYNGRTTIDGLFAKLGYAYTSDYKSNNTYFSIPQCSVVSLFDNVTKYASFANGGGAHFYMAQNGVIHGYDYKLIKEKAKSEYIFGNILSETIKTDWSVYTPSEFNLFGWDQNNNFKTELLSLVKGFGRASVYLNDTTGVWKDSIKQELANTFYNKWYNGHTITIDVAMGVIPTLGSLVDLNNEGQTFIVKGVSITYNDNQSVPSVSAVLISNPLF